MKLKSSCIAAFDDFIENEIRIMDMDTYYSIYNFIALDNFRKGEYEGNIYVIRKINVDHIQLENEVSTANTPKPKVFVYTKKEFLGLLQSHKPGF
ncbi:hypothetical protein SporoP17a_16000 [Sporosarcina ureae]|nr:hypothetical protein SporoP17a_16000 [Sporosarcina ureae]